MNSLRKHSCRPFGTIGAGLIRIPWAGAHGYTMSPLRGYQDVHFWPPTVSSNPSAFMFLGKSIQVQRACKLPHPGLPLADLPPSTVSCQVASGGLGNPTFSCFWNEMGARKNAARAESIFGKTDARGNIALIEEQRIAFPQFESVSTKL